MDIGGIISQLSEGQIGAGGITVLILFIILGVVKGIIRVILGFAGLIAAGIAFWFTFQNGDSLIANVTDNPEPWMPLGLAGGAAVGAYTIARHGLGIIFKPLLGSVDDFKKRRVLSGIAGLGLGGIGLFTGGCASHQFDTMSLLNDIKEEKESGWVTSLLNKTQESWFGNFQQKADPFKTAYRCDLIKALTLYTSGQSDIYQKEALETLLNNQSFLELASKPEIAQLISTSDFQSLYRHPQIKAFIRNPDNIQILQGIDWLAL